MEKVKKPELQKYKFYFDWTDNSSGIFYTIEEIIASRKTKFQQVDILKLGEIGLSLVIDGKIQIAELDEFVYHEVIVHIPAITFGNPERFLIIGGGDGCALREALKYKSVKEVTLVDIDREVVEMCKEYLSHINMGAFFDPRSRVLYEDGRKFIETTNEKFDIIIMDTVDPLEFGPAYMLFTKEFMEKIKDRLTENGIVIIQSNTIYPGGSRFLHAMYRTIEATFPKVSFASAYLRSFMLNWAFIIGSKRRIPEELSYDEIKASLSTIETKYLTPDIFKACIAKPKFFIEDIRKSNEIITDKSPIFAI